jgi:hypothetical protein
MNEKIKLLAERAGITFTDYGSGEFLGEDDIDTDRLENFAKLVIEEYKREVKEDRRETKSKLGYSRIGLKNV